MNQEWPLPKAAPDEAAPLLPLALEEHVELIKASPAIDAFARKRAVQILTHGHTPEKDLLQAVGHLAFEAKARLNAFAEISGRLRPNLPPEQRERCLRYVEITGAMLIALWERCQVEVPEE